MYPPPQIIESEVFARMPDRLRIRDRPVDWLRVQRRGLPVDSFLEGPSFDRDGNLYVVDVPYGRIFRVDPRGEFELVVEYDGEPNGLKICRDGRIFVADHKHGLMLLDPAAGRIEAFCDRPTLERFKGLNDLFIARDGNFYFTDQGQTGLQDPTGRVYRLSPTGRLDCLMDNIPSPNGIVLDTETTTIYVAVTRANAIWRLPLTLDGVPSKVGLFIQMSGGVGPDGLAFDELGNLLVCHPGTSSAWLFSPSGEPLYRVRSCADDFITNAAYGGEGRQWLYLVESHSGSILRARMPFPGRAMDSHMDEHAQ